MIKKWQFLNVAAAALLKKVNVNQRNVQNVEKLVQWKKLNILRSRVKWKKISTKIRKNITDVRIVAIYTNLKRDVIKIKYCPKPPLKNCPKTTDVQYVNPKKLDSIL